MSPDNIMVISEFAIYHVMAISEYNSLMIVFEIIVPAGGDPDNWYMKNDPFKADSIYCYFWKHCVHF